MGRVTIIGVGIAFLAVGATPPPGHSKIPRIDQPNVLIIVTDDQRATEGGLAVMPATRRWFGEGGTRFSSAFATTPLCCPARASIFSGRYAHNHGVFTNLGEFTFDEDFTIQHYLDGAGYNTALTGKYFNNWDVEDDPANFDRWALFDGGYYGHDYNLNGTMRHVSDYSTNFIADKTVDFLEAFERTDTRPWMLYVATYAPHATFIPETSYRGARVPRWGGNPAVFEDNRGDKPRYVRIRDETYDTWGKYRRLQLRALMSVDDLVAEVSRALRRLDEGSDTLAFYLSDNGYIWADHGLYDKGAPYTPSIQIPMFMRWPGRVDPGVREERLVGNVDIAPTVLDAAGLIPAPGHPMDGRSLLDSSWTRPRILTEYRNSGNVWTPPTWASLRTPDLQYVEYYDEGERIFREYYDLRADPWQLTNLLFDGDPANNPDASTLRILSDQLSADRSCVGITCP